MSENQVPPPLPVSDPISQFFWDGAGAVSCGSSGAPAATPTSTRPARCAGRACPLTWRRHR